MPSCLIRSDCINPAAFVLKNSFLKLKIKMLANISTKCVRCTHNKSFIRQVHNTRRESWRGGRNLAGSLHANKSQIVQQQPSIQFMRNYSAHFSYVPDTVPSSEGETVRMNLFQAVNNAMDMALASDPTASTSSN